MAEGKGKRLDLKELKKSFPSLDENSVSKLLGGGGHNPDGWTPPPFGSDTYDLGELSSVVIYHNGSGTGNSSGGSQGGPGGPRGPGVSGSDYFGDWDSGDDYGDFGWGEGWGDYDGGTDSNPDGSEGGNGQNSSGNPGNELLHFTPGFELDIENIDGESWHGYGASGVYNTTADTIWVKPENEIAAIPIPPGGHYVGEVDGVSAGGIVYKFTNGYGTIDVSISRILTNYTNPFEWLYQEIAGGRQYIAPDYTWVPLFNAH